MIKNGATISSVIKGSTPIQVIKKGLVTVFEAFKKLSVSGIAPLTLENSVGKDLEDYKIYGKSVQDGTPTPETPIEIESVGEYDETTGKYKIPVKVSGKNLFNKDNYSSANNLYISNGIISNTYGCSVWYIPCLPNTTYTVSGVNSEGRFQISAFTDIPKTSGQKADSYSATRNETGFTKNPVSLTITTGATSKYLAIWNWWDGRGSYTINEVLDSMQIEYGSIATEKINYIEPTITNIYLNEPLRKVGIFADYIDYKNKKVVRNIGQHIYDGSEDEVWGIGTAFNGFYIIDTTFHDGALPMCNIAQGELINQTSILSVRKNYSHIRMQGFINVANNVNSFIELLKKNPAIIICKLATPTEETIELPSIATSKGTNIIDIETNVKPSNLEIEYFGLT